MFKRIRDWANQNEGFIGLIGLLIVVLPSIVKAVLSLLNVAPSMVGFLQQYREIAVVIGFCLLVLAFTLALSNHRRRLSSIEEKLQILETAPATLLDQTQSPNLGTWSYEGRWMSDQDGLSVTDSWLGGICKIGATWENYEFTFEFKIINKCAGWIVRAASLDHYVMIQCNNRQLRPHIRKVMEQSSEASKPEFKVLQEIEHGLSLSEWNKARTEVMGHSIKVWVEDKLVWSDSDLLKDFQMGTVGFRCADKEHALFRSVQVIRK